MDYAHENFTFKNLGIYIYICLCTGMRIGKFWALWWQDIDMEEW